MDTGLSWEAPGTFVLAVLDEPDVVQDAGKSHPSNAISRIATPAPLHAETVIEKSGLAESFRGTMMGRSANEWERESWNYNSQHGFYAKAIHFHASLPLG